jgi:hypothetical protein
MEWVFGHAGTDWCLTAVAANGQPGFAAYRRAGDGYELHTLHHDRLTRTSDPHLFEPVGQGASVLYISLAHRDSLSNL